MAPDNNASKPEIAPPAEVEGAERRLTRRTFLAAGFSRAVATLLVGSAAASLGGCLFYEDYSDYSDYYDYYSNYYGNYYSNYYSDYYVYYSNYSNYSA